MVSDKVLNAVGNFSVWISIFWFVAIVVTEFTSIEFLYLVPPVVFIPIGIAVANYVSFEERMQKEELLEEP